jgi:hypothetical protein
VSQRQNKTRRPARKLRPRPGAKVIEGLAVDATRRLGCGGDPEDEIGPFGLRPQLLLNPVAQAWHVDERHGRASLELELIFRRARGGRQRPYRAPRFLRQCLSHKTWPNFMIRIPFHRRTEEIGACLADPFANGEDTD